METIRYLQSLLMIFSVVIAAVAYLAGDKQLTIALMLFAILVKPGEGRP